MHDDTHLDKCPNLHNDHVDTIFVIVHVNGNVLKYCRTSHSEEAHHGGHGHEDNTFTHQRMHASACNSSCFSENQDQFTLESKMGATMKFWMTQTSEVDLGAGLQTHFPGPKQSMTTWKWMNKMT